MILLSKLNHYGIRGIALELICDYLSNRKQFVFYDNDCYSILSDISIGVPQGSVLGPLFFIIYVNDIISCMDDSSKIILFADDTNIFVSASTIEELYDKANMILLKLKNYIDANYLHINLKKSKFIHFRTSRTKVSTRDLFYENFKLEKVTSIKLSGLSLVWEDHIKSITVNSAKFQVRFSNWVNAYREIYYVLFILLLLTRSLSMALVYGAQLDLQLTSQHFSPLRRNLYVHYFVYRG